MSTALSLSATDMLQGLQNSAREIQSEQHPTTALFQAVVENPSPTQIKSLNIESAKKSEESPLQKLFAEATALFQKSSPEEQLAVRTYLSQQLFPELISQKSSAAPVVKPSIKEEDFRTIFAEIEKLVKDTEETKRHADTRIQLIAGLTPSLNINDPAYESKKGEALKRFTDYESLFNEAVDRLISMKEQEEKIKTLTNATIETINQFIKTNCAEREYFQTQFEKLSSEHGFVTELVTQGYESTKTRIWGSSLGIATPQAHKSEAPIEAKGLVDNFTPLFNSLNSYYMTLDSFSNKVQKHLNVVAGTRKGWTEKNPGQTAYKENASLLMKKYEPLVKECSIHYSHLDNHNTLLENLKVILQKTLEDKSKQIANSRQLLVEQFKTYAEQSQALDRKINGGNIVQTKNIRFLTAQTKDKYAVATA